MSIDRSLALAASVALLASLLAGLLSFYYWESIKLLAAGFALVVVGALSRYPERFARESFGFELGVFFSVCSSFALGLFGVAVGAGYSIAAGWVAREPPQDTLVGFLCIVVVSFLATLVSPANVLLYGLGFVFLYDLLCLGIYSFSGHSVFGGIKFMAGHMLWNYVVFSLWGEKLVALLSSL